MATKARIKNAACVVIVPVSPTSNTAMTLQNSRENARINTSSNDTPTTPSRRRTSGVKRPSRKTRSCKRRLSGRLASCKPRKNSKVAPIISARLSVACQNVSKFTERSIKSRPEKAPTSASQLSLMRVPTSRSTCTAAPATFFGHAAAETTAARAFSATDFSASASACLLSFFSSAGAASAAASSFAASPVATSPCGASLPAAAASGAASAVVASLFALSAFSVVSSCRSCAINTLRCAGFSSTSASAVSAAWSSVLAASLPAANALIPNKTSKKRQKRRIVFSCKKRFTYRVATTLYV